MELTCSAIQEALGIPEENRKCPKGKVFRFARINLVRAACPDSLRKRLLNRAIGMPIIVEKNREGLGRVEATGYIPEAVIVAGATRRDYLLEQGIIRGWAWVEDGSMEIRAEEAIGSDVLMTKLNSALITRIYSSGMISGQAYPHVFEIHPFESYVLYELSGQTYRQGYQLDHDSEVRLSGIAQPLKSVIQANNKDSMPPVQTGIRYSYAYTLGNNQSTNRGGKTSELITQVIRNFSDINTAVQMYLDAVKNGLHKPMKPAFQPVKLTDAGKIQAALASKGITPLDFAVWGIRALVDASKGKKAVGTGEQVDRSKFAYVGDPKDPSTWKLPIHDESHAKNALARVNQADIPKEARPAVLGKIRRKAKSFGVGLSDSPTHGQKTWAKKVKVA